MGKLPAGPLRAYVQRLLQHELRSDLARRVAATSCVSFDGADKFLERLMQGRYHNVSVWWVDRVTIAAGSHPILLYGREWEEAVIPDIRETGHCVQCGGPMPPPRGAVPRVFCGARCRNYFYGRKEATRR